MKTHEATLLNKRVKLLQPEQGFRTGLDAVMVAAAATHIDEGDRVLDMGCGAGGVSFCLLERCTNIHVTGIDIQSDYISLAKSNAALNQCEESVAFIQSDVFEFTAATPDDRFDHIVTNPPFLQAGAHITSPVEGKTIAIGHQGKADTLERWMKKALELLKSGGSLTIIHRADHADQIIIAMGRSFGEIEIIPLWPKEGRNAKRIIIRGVKDKRGVCKMHAGLILHKQNGDYTDGCNAILRDVQPLV